MSELYIDFDENSEKSNDYSYLEKKNIAQSASDSSEINYLSNSKTYLHQISSVNLFAQAYSNEDNPRMSVQSITQQQFPEFSHFFICITRAFNLVGCSMKSLLLKIRVLPSLPIIETNTVWCIDGDVNFRCGYALDFKNYAKTFNLGDYTPVVEFYRKTPNKNESNDLELFAFSLLPLSVAEITDCAGLPLTYLMKNQTIELRQFTTGQIVGYITVTIALGYPQQQQFIDPDKNDIPSSSKVQNAINQQSPEINQTNKKIDNDAEEEEDEEDDHKHRKRHRHHRKSQKKNTWIQKAMAFGWKPPGYVDPDWKDKAIEKGWTPPNKTLLSSIGVTCKPTECPNLKDIEIQQIEAEIDLHKQFLQPQLDNSTSTSTSTSKENDNQTDDSTIQLFNLMNPNKNINKGKDINANCLHSDEFDSVPSKRPALKATNVLILFDKPQPNDISSSSNDIDILDIINNRNIDANNVPCINAEIPSSSSSSSTHIGDLKNVEIDSNSDISKQNATSIEKLPNVLPLNQQKPVKQPKIPQKSLLNANVNNQSLNSIINDNISKVKKEFELSDDSIDDEDLNLNATTIQIFKELNIPLDKLNIDLNSDLSQSSDSNLETNSNISIDDDKNININIPKQIDSKQNLLDSESILDSDSIINSNSALDSPSNSDSDSNADNFLNLLEKKDPAFTNILNILNDK